MNRQLAVAVRRFADSNSARLDEIPTMRGIVATVDSVTAGGKPSGNALVRVSWRGGVYEANGYHASYTPAPGDRVECHLIDGQLIVVDVIAA